MNQNLIFCLHHLWSRHFHTSFNRFHNMENSGFVSQWKGGTFFSCISKHLSVQHTLNIIFTWYNLLQCSDLWNARKAQMFFFFMKYKYIIVTLMSRRHWLSISKKKICLWSVFRCGIAYLTSCWVFFVVCFSKVLPSCVSQCTLTFQQHAVSPQSTRLKWTNIGTGLIVPL